MINSKILKSNLFFIINFIIMFVLTSYNSEFNEFIPINNFYLKIIFIILFLYIIILKRLINFKINIKKRYLIILIILISTMIISLIYTIDFKSTIYYLTDFILLNVYLIYLKQKKIDLPMFLKGVFTFFYVIGILNLIFILFFKNISLFYDTRYTVSYRGIFNHRTMLGYFSVISICISNILLYNYNFWRKNLIINILISLVLVYCSHSGIGITILFIYPIIYILLSKVKVRYEYIMIIYLIINYIITNATDILIKFNTFFVNVLNRDFTLSGRLDLWKNGIDLIKERIWLGYGLGAKLPVFNYESYESSLAHLHNGILEIVSHIGVIGLIPVILILCLSYKKVELLYKNKSILFKLFFIVILIVGFTEPYLFYKIGVSYAWIIILYIFII